MGAILLTGCYWDHLQQYKSLDQTARTITVPSGGGGLAGALKNVLKQQGWRLAVVRGPKVTEGKLGEKTKLQEYGTFNTRYQLKLSSSVVGVSLLFDPIYYYDISIIDVQNGDEVLTLSGRNTEHDIIDAFRAAINSKSKEP